VSTPEQAGAGQRQGGAVAVPGVPLAVEQRQHVGALEAAAVAQGGDGAAAGGVVGAAGAGGHGSRIVAWQWSTTASAQA
jgi:hypothetical protein